MLTEQGVVEAIDGDYAWVVVTRQTACGQCASNKSCGTGLLAKVFPNRPLRLHLQNVLGVSTGDQVLVAIEEGLLLRGALLAYAFPLFLMFTGAAIGASMQHVLADPAGESVSILGGLAGLMLGCFGLSRLSRRLAANPRYAASMVELVRAAGSAKWTLNKE